MTLPSSGPISASDINTELGVGSTTTFSLNQASARDLAGVPSGTISYSDFYGKSAGSVALPGTTQSITKIGGPINGTVTTASWNFRSDGQVVGGVQTTGYSGSADHTWWSEAPDAGIGASYQIRCTLISGTAPQGLSTGVWYSLSSDRGWFLNATSTVGQQNKSNSMTFEIRNASTLVIVDSGTYNLTSTYISLD